MSIKTSKELDPNKLFKADVILTGVEDWRESFPIKAGNILHGRFVQYKWTHVGLHVGDLQLAESIPNPGVTIRNLQTTYIDKGIDIAVMRHPSITDDQKNCMIDFCKQEIREESKYDKWALSYFVLQYIFRRGGASILDTGVFWRNLFDKWINEDSSYFCSELVTTAFREAGLKFRPRYMPWQVMPVDFYNLKIFRRIDDIWK